MANARILIVEDDADIASMLKLFFSEKGYTVEVAPNGLDALKQSQNALFRLIILDILLPGLDGFEVCRRLRANPRTNHIPIVFLTQMDELRDKLHGLELGADDYLTKPFYIQELLTRVENTIARAEHLKLVEPLTGLPGPKKIEDRLGQTAETAHWALLNVAIRDFPGYQETHGLAAGNALLRKTADLLGETLDRAGGPDDFVGHAGQGVFLILTAEERAAALRGELQAGFEKELAPFGIQPDGLQEAAGEGLTSTGAPLRISIEQLAAAGSTAELARLLRAKPQVSESSLPG